MISSMGELNRAFKLELNLVHILTSHKAEFESSLDVIRDFIGTVEEMYVKEDCWPMEKCDEDRFAQRILANPIYNYQVLKRLVVDIKNVEEKLKAFDVKSKVLLTEPSKLCIVFFVHN